MNTGKVLEEILRLTTTIELVPADLEHFRSLAIDSDDDGGASEDFGSTLASRGPLPSRRTNAQIPEAAKYAKYSLQCIIEVSDYTNSMIITARNKFKHALIDRVHKSAGGGKSHRVTKLDAHIITSTLFDQFL